MATGRFLKNYQLNIGQGFVLPSGGTDTRPDAPAPGIIRFNTNTTSIEYFNGTQFETIADTGAIDRTIDSFTGDGSTTVFTMSTQEDTAGDILVFVGSIYQDSTSAYTVDGGFDITFTSAPPDGLAISVIHTSV